MFLLPPIHLRYSRGELPVYSLQKRDCHFEIPLQFHSGGVSHSLRGSLRFQIQFGFLQNTFARDTRTLAPSRIKLRRFPGVAMVLYPDCGHAFALLRAHARHRRQKFHRHLCRNLSGLYLVLNCRRQ